MKLKSKNCWPLLILYCPLVSIIPFKCSEVSHYLIKLLRAEITEQPHKTFRELVLKRNKNVNHCISQLLIASPLTFMGFFHMILQIVSDKIPGKKLSYVLYSVSG